MKKTIQMVVVATLCLNFCYAQNKNNCPKPETTRTYVYAFSGFKSGYKTGYRISEDQFMKGRVLTVRNYTITQLFALALRLERPHNTSINANEEERIIIDVRQPEKLKKLYCYKLVVPYNHQDDFYVLMQRSLNYEFPEYEVKMEKRDKEYFMVIRDKEY